MPIVPSDLLDKPWIAIDIETTSLDPLEGKIRILSIALPDGRSISVDIWKHDPAPWARALSESPGVKIAHNAKFEVKWIRHHWGVDLDPVFDTWRASEVIGSGQLGIKHHLWAVYERYLGIDTSKMRDMGRSNWAGPLSEEQLEYAEEDVKRLGAIMDAQVKILRREGLVRTIQIENRAVLAEADAELVGFGMDVEAWLALASKQERLADDLDAEIKGVLPHPTGQLGLFGPGYWDLGSAEQLMKSLARFGIDVPSTGKDEIAHLAPEHPIVGRVFAWRDASKKATAFGTAYMRHVKDGRIRTQYRPFTRTGRFASSGPNLQQIPRDKAYRACFRAPEGRVLVAADYPAIEMRIACAIAQDATMFKAFRDGVDVHAFTAAIVNSTGIDQVTKGQRQAAKAVNFGLIYGMGSPKLAHYALTSYGVALTLAEAATFRDRFFEAYSGIARWHKTAIAKGKASGETRTMAGRRRIFEDSSKVYSDILNSPVQGTGADAIKIALRLVYDRLPGDAHICHHVHDEIVVECDDDPEVIGQVKGIVSDSMGEAIQCFVKGMPIPIEAQSGKSWADIK